MQTFKIEMFKSDFEKVQAKMPMFEKLFGSQFRILGQRIVDEKEDPDAEWDENTEPEDLLEIEMRFSTSNHLWLMAKVVGQMKTQSA